MSLGEPSQMYLRRLDFLVQNNKHPPPSQSNNTQTNTHKFSNSISDSTEYVPPASAHNPTKSPKLNISSPSKPPPLKKTPATMTRLSMLGLSLIAALLPATIMGDSLNRYECYCVGSSISGYYFEYQYSSDRLGITIDAQTKCSGPIGNPPTCDSDASYLVNTCGSSPDGHQFCYDQDLFSGDDYALDGVKRQLDAGSAHDLGGLDEYCSSVCSYLDPGLKTDCGLYVCKAQSFSGLEQI